MHQNKVTQQQRIAVIDLTIPDDPAVVNVFWKDIVSQPWADDMANEIQDAIDDGFFLHMEDDDDLDY